MTVLWDGSGLLLVGLMAVLILRETRKEMVPYLLTAMCITIFCISIPLMQEMVDWVRVFQKQQPYTQTLLKAVGIVMLTEVSCEICKAAGENGIAGYAAWVGKIELFMMTFPMFRELTVLAAGLTG